MIEKYIVKNISLKYTDPKEYAIKKAESIIKQAGGKVAGSQIYRRSVDARKKSNIQYVYSVCVLGEGIKEKQLKKYGISVEEDTDISVKHGEQPLSDRPVICGFGPAGMFSALILASNGYKPVVCERGPNIHDRQQAVEMFATNQILNTEANIQFGAGGAGTFSDGKLITRINDPLCKFVLDTFCKFGASEDILVNARPHIGTDVLCKIVENFATEIERLGGEILYNTKIESWTCNSDGTIKSVHTKNGDIPCGALILAPGHSARDMYGLLLNNKETIKPKPISVGFRIEHLRRNIDCALYGDCAGDPLLGPAEYNLSTHIDGTGVYTFCMCPGGEVLAAASEEGEVVTNGSSNSRRDGVNSNCAVAVSINMDNPMGFQYELERAAFRAGGNNYYAPIQTVGDFLKEEVNNSPSVVLPTYMRGKTKVTDLNKLFPAEISKCLRLGITDFGKKIKGFDDPSACLTGVESRTSAPYRIERNEDKTMIGHANIFPCGEGAGYAGGITSAAVDGIKCAMALIEKYKEN